MKTCLGRGQLHFHILGAVSGQKAHAVAPLEAEIHHDVGHAVGSLLQLSVSHNPIAIDDGSMIRIDRGPTME